MFLAEKEDEEINNLKDVDAALKKLEDANFKKEEASTLSPLFVYLSSSLNIELVYIILKGITKFSYITCADSQGGLNENTAKKAAKLNLVYLANGDVMLKLDVLKMKDFAKWDNDLTGDEASKPVKDQVTIKSEIKVISHRVDLFKDMFKSLFQS